MPSRSRRRSRGRFNFDRFVPLLQVLLMLSVFSNFIVVFFFERDRTPRIVREIETVTTNHLIVVTNFISSSTVSTNRLSSSSLHRDRDDNSVRLPYHYFMFDGYPAFRLYGRNYSIGSPTSYGRVKMIFPDRIQLDNGIWINNTSPFQENFNNNSKSDKVKKEGIKKDDRIRNK